MSGARRAAEAWLLKQASHPSPLPPRSLTFDDLHSSGIYSWQYLHELGTQKCSRMRRYLTILKDRGLSRDPPRARQRQRGQQGHQQGHQQHQRGGSSSSGGNADAASSSSSAS